MLYGRAKPFSYRAWILCESYFSSHYEVARTCFKRRFRCSALNTYPGRVYWYVSSKYFMDFPYFFGVSPAHNHAISIPFKGFFCEGNILCSFCACFLVVYCLAVAFVCCFVAHVSEKYYASLKLARDVKYGF